MHIVDHLNRLRSLQEETGKFNTFILMEGVMLFNPKYNHLYLNNQSYMYL